VSEPKKYTAEVLRAMEAQGIALAKPAPPPDLPPGHVRYFIAIGSTQLRGEAPITTVAAQLRTLADQIESSEGASNG
jgi:hypothetical protein